MTEFLALYGIEKIYRTESLAKNAKMLETTSAEGGVKDYYDAWEAKIDEKIRATYTNASGESIPSDQKYQLDKYEAFREYTEALANYQKQATLYENGVNVDLPSALKTLSEAKQKYSDTITFDKWAQSQAAYTLDPTTGAKVETEEFKNVQKYYEILEEFLTEAEDLGCTNVNKPGDNGAYKYNDATKAQWYTNLWYKMNGSSSDKSAQGSRAANYAVLDPKLASSKDWIQDALEQGIISIEVASYTDASNLIENESRPLTVQLQGISWTPTEYSSCIDFTEVDDEDAVARAEAEYQKKNNEISAKDKRYESKIKTLDTEHNALQTQYESVKSAMTKNIDRSFKTFSG